MFASGNSSQSGLVVFKEQTPELFLLTLHRRGSSRVAPQFWGPDQLPPFQIQLSNGLRLLVSYSMHGTERKYEVGPLIAQKTPETLLEIDLSAAKSASVYSYIRHSADLSPIQPNIEMSMFWWIYETILSSLWSHMFVHFVFLHAKIWQECRRSYLAILAPYKIVRMTFAAMDCNCPLGSLSSS